jgi:bifunctional UDP-N-acetylglucosamine pyrophosphorylase/glucosamine-1-phosphate N-acetyltransferase
MKKLNIVILAAGKGERMLSKKPKVMHEIMGRPMIGYVVERAKELSPARIVVVVGYGREKVEAYLKGYNIDYSIQTKQKGTAHALLSAIEFIKDGDVLVLYGDVPLIESATLKNFLKFYEKFKAITFMITDVDDPSGYGRAIIEKDEILKIIEEADTTPEERKIERINTGICIIPRQSFNLLKDIKPDNKKGEYYLTDICSIAKRKGLSVKGYHYQKASEVLGINTRKELLEANITMKDRILDKHMQDGVTLLDRNIFIESNVKIGRDTIISPNCHLIGNTIIGENVTIGPNTIIKDTKIHGGVNIEGFVVIDGAEIKEGTRIGPFSRIRPATFIGKGVEIGNFVEIKNSVIQDKAKANHLSYIGDAEIGREVNIGAGTITCNYDGKKKHKTIIEDNVFVGSNTELIAPVRIGKDAVIGAGSTITKDVPDGALAISRTRQKHVKGYGRKKGVRNSRI